jgi:hypothetical protein
LYIYTRMILRFILYALGIYILYKVIFEVVIPVAKTTQKIRQQFGAMQEHMRDQMNTTQNGHPKQPKAASPEAGQSTKSGDYIDFEEVK